MPTTETHPADDAWASIAETYDPTPSAPAAPARIRVATTVPEKPRVTKNGQVALDLGTEEEFSDSLPNQAETKPADNLARFDEFWAAWPKRVSKSKARKVWASQKLDTEADAILADLPDRLARHAQWANKQYIPHPDKFLRNRLWEDEIIEAGTGGNRHDRHNAAKRPETRRDKRARVQCDTFSAFRNEKADTEPESAVQTGPGVVLRGDFGSN